MSTFGATEKVCQRARRLSSASPWRRREGAWSSVSGRSKLATLWPGPCLAGRVGGLACVL